MTVDPRDSEHPAVLRRCLDYLPPGFLIEARLFALAPDTYEAWHALVAHLLSTNA